MHGVQANAKAMPMTGAAHSPRREGRTSKRCSPVTRVTTLRVPEPAWAQTLRRQRAEQHDGAEEDDHGAAHMGERDLVRIEQAADARSGRAQRDEDHREPGHEEPDAPQDRAQGGRRRCTVPAGLQLGGREARDHGDVARHEGQHAGGDERQNPGTEGDEDTGRIG